MGVGLVRSLQPPDILWIHWRVYNSIANTSKWGTLLPHSDAYVRSFLYLLYFNKTLLYTHMHTHTQKNPTANPRKHAVRGHYTSRAPGNLIRTRHFYFLRTQLPIN